MLKIALPFCIVLLSLITILESYKNMVFLVIQNTEAV